MRLKTRLSKLETSSPKPSRLIELHPDDNGQPTAVSVIGGATHYRENYPDKSAFWYAVYADEKQARDADPHNPDPLGGLFRHVAKYGKRLGDAA